MSTIVFHLRRRILSTIVMKNITNHSVSYVLQNNSTIVLQDITNQCYAEYYQPLCCRILPTIDSQGITNHCAAGYYQPLYCRILPTIVLRDIINHCVEEYYQPLQATGRSTSGFHRPGRHCWRQARSTVRWCSANRMRGDLLLPIIPRTIFAEDFLAYG